LVDTYQHIPLSGDHVEKKKIADDKIPNHLTIEQIPLTVDFFRNRMNAAMPLV
jgi:hypothetical protein